MIKTRKIMKKLLIAAIAVLGFTTANAQYVAEKGDIQTSIEFRPFNNGGNEMFANGIGVNGTYFFTDKDAVRVGLDFSSDSGKYGDVKNSDFTFGFTVGYENHFKTYDRVDLFAGIEAGFGTRTIKYDGKKVNGGYTQFGVDVFTGINFYVYKKLFIGAELGLGYNHYNYNKYQVYDDGSEYQVLEEEYDPKSSNNTIKFFTNPALKIGWTF